MKEQNVVPACQEQTEVSALAWAPLLEKIEDLMKTRLRVLLSIDGDSGSGKTSCAAFVQQAFGGNVFHMDDYFLPAAQRKANWQQLPAGNMDLARFERDVLQPVRAGEYICYQPFDCQKQDYEPLVHIEATKLTVVEGSYSQHPVFASFYDLRVFLCCDKKTQETRLLERVGARYPMFENCWLPMEKLYQETCQIREKADLLIDTSCMSVE